MILQELIQEISERISQVRDGVHHAGVRRTGTRRARLLVGVALCAVALFAFTGCPDTPEAGPVITLTGSKLILVAIRDTTTDTNPGATVRDENDPDYMGVVTATITNDSTDAIILLIDTETAGEYTITYTASPNANGNMADPVTRTVRVGRDSDINNRIDINFLEDLNAVRYNFASTSYKTSEDGTEIRCGMLGETVCEGYELRRDLDFAADASYENGMVNPEWRPMNTGADPENTDPDSATNPGWEPIGGRSGHFTGMFFGNGFAISNLYVRSDEEAGLFGTSNGTIEQIGVVDVNIYGGEDFDDVGGLVGLNGGTITKSYATGNINGGGNIDNVGGLVGRNAGTITKSYATGNINGETGRDDVGGLVGANSPSGIITESYATGDARGGAGKDNVGGLLGNNGSSTIGVGIIAVAASYATGNVYGEGGSDNVGGLVGENGSSSAIGTSYATGDVYGGAENDSVGGLVGSHATNSAITATYATGDAYGGAGEDDEVGGLVGRNANSQVTASYATGDASGGEGLNDSVTSFIGVINDSTPAFILTASYGFGATQEGERTGDGATRSSDTVSLINACDITQTNSSIVEGNDWDPAQWNFGNMMQRPLVRHENVIVPGQPETDRGC